MDAESQQVDDLKKSLHEAGARNGALVLQLREKDLVIVTMNEAHKLLMIEKDAQIERLKRYESEYKKREWDEAILCNNLFKAKELITELCDALEEEYGSNLGDGRPLNLLQRAREATQ